MLLSSFFLIQVGRCFDQQCRDRLYFFDIGDGFGCFGRHGSLASKYEFSRFLIAGISLLFLIPGIVFAVSISLVASMFGLLGTEVGLYWDT